jgi:uncharacterized protein YidB (DUF937 family)
MGILDQVLGALSAGQAGTSAGGASGIDGGALLQQVISVLGSSSAGGASGQAGLGGIVAAFEQGGLGHIMQSWIGKGANLPISADQIQSVLGSGAISQIAQALGVNGAQVSAGLSSMLPALVDHLTPHGELPQAGAAGGDLTALARQLMG